MIIVTGGCGFIGSNIVKHLNDRGIEFYTMCIPNKEIVYPENMPDTIARVNEVSRGQQLDEYLEANSDVILDLQFFDQGCQ